MAKKKEEWQRKVAKNIAAKPDFWQAVDVARRDKEHSTGLEITTSAYVVFLCSIALGLDDDTSQK